MKRTELILIVFNILFVEQGQSTDCDECSDYLISGPRGILDANITASSTRGSSFGHGYDPKYGRLHFTQNSNPVAGGWTAGTNNDKEYIQAEFSKLKLVKAIATQGRATWDQWVTSYSVSFSIDGLSWSTVEDVNGNSVSFPANSDRSTVVTNNLPDCIEAKYIRIYPRTWYGEVSMRFDAIGCTKLDKKRNKINWRRHPIVFGQDVQRNLTQDFVIPSNSINVCAVKCQQNSLCLSFSPKQTSSTCIGFQEQIYQGDMISFSAQGDDAYFISLSQLEEFEYKILENPYLCYKIFTSKGTADSASTLCKKGRARLLSILDLDQMSVIQNSFSNNLILSQESYLYVDGSYQNGLWKYATDKDIPTSLWSPSHPISDNGGCVTLTLNGLETHNCNDSLYFICGM